MQVIVLRAFAVYLIARLACLFGAVEKQDGFREAFKWQVVGGGMFRSINELVQFRLPLFAVCRAQAERVTSPLILLCSTPNVRFPRSQRLLKGQSCLLCPRTGFFFLRPDSPLWHPRHRAMQDEPDDASPFPNPPPYDEAAESFTWPPALPAQPVATASNFSTLGGRHGRAQTPRTVSAARLPSYKHALYGRYRTHPYRRPFKPTAQAKDYDYDNVRASSVLMSSRRPITSPAGSRDRVRVDHGHCACPDAELDSMS